MLFFLLHIFHQNTLSDASSVRNFFIDLIFKTWQEQRARGDKNKVFCQPKKKSVENNLSFFFVLRTVKKRSSWRLTWSSIERCEIAFQYEICLAKSLNQNNWKHHSAPMRALLRILITMNFNRSQPHHHLLREIIYRFQILDGQPSSQKQQRTSTLFHSKLFWKRTTVSTEPNKSWRRSRKTHWSHKCRIARPHSIQMITNT